MKTTPFKFCLVLAALVAGGPAVFAQSNGVPGPNEYDKFSHFITDRNIFDPTRQPHYTTTTRYTRRLRPSHSGGMTGIQLVGTMSYEKGPFAFFNASDPDNRKALHPGEKLAGYTVTEITDKSVTLESTNKTVVVMGIGDGLQPDSNGKWVYTKADDMSAPVVVSGSRSYGGSSTSGDSESSTPSAPPSASAPNDTLKRLMEQREKLTQ